eukprot:CAMPEP_0184679758 /NCGR_PEP_ID=MMETSP0312-20130426/2620_1 /TAXON_ID=31354 /ORGANISM="Compsopogon coeruleus, Strain SAG 36.94" /LENGTH=613 /DNA_ID=CAMNT_0027129417 /DNA_START=697 /DNA_END=2538 /DNA_ORIENTATION=-
MFFGVIRATSRDLVGADSAESLTPSRRRSSRRERASERGSGKGDHARRGGIGVGVAVGFLVVMLGNFLYVIYGERFLANVSLQRLLEEVTLFPYDGLGRNTSRESLVQVIRTTNSRLTNRWDVDCIPCTNRECPEGSSQVPSLDSIRIEQASSNYACLPFPSVSCCRRIQQSTRIAIQNHVIHLLEPWSFDGISHSTMDIARALAEKDANTVIIQVIEGKIYVVIRPDTPVAFYNISSCSANRNDVVDGVPIGSPYDQEKGSHSSFKLDNPSLRLRLRFAVQIIQHYLNIREEPPPDFEFALSTHSTGVYPDYLATAEAKNMRFLSFGMLSRTDRPTIPFLRHDGVRDIDFSRYEEVRNQYRCAMDVPWASKDSRAVFRGTFFSRSISNLYSQTDVPDYKTGKITKDNWKDMGRSALLYYRKLFPEYLNVNLLDFPVIRRRKYGVGLEYLGDNPGNLSLEEQLLKFKMVIAAEASNGWSETLRHLFFSNSAVVKQQMPFQEWFEPLLKNGTHVLEVDSNWLNLKEVLSAAVSSDAATMSVGSTGRDMMDDLLSVEGQTLYATLLLEGYAQLMKYRPRRGRGAAQVSCTLSDGSCVWIDGDGARRSYWDPSIQI